MVSEKRKNRRVKFNDSVRFQFKNSQFFGGCVAKNISENGIKINLSMFIPLSNELFFQIQLGVHQMIECAGKIVWIEKIRFAERYQAGVLFLKTDSFLKTRQQIKNFI